MGLWVAPIGSHHLFTYSLLFIERPRTRSKSRGHCCSLDVGRSTDTRLLRVSAKAVSAIEESGFLPFSEDKREPSLAAGDGQATADARDVFGFSAEHHKEKSCGGHDRVFSVDFSRTFFILSS